MTGFLGGPKVQYLDSNGDPLSGGKLHTYEPGTTTNKASYPTIADSIAGSNANANPVVLDSRGEADIVLAGNTKLLLKTSADVTIWTLDNVEPNTVMLDANGNELFLFTSTDSAVNELTVANAATGNGPTISATGDDTNIDINITPKGSGVVTVTNLSGTIAPSTPLAVAGSASSSAELRLAEDTDNGTNYMSIKAPAAITSNVTLTLPDGDAANANDVLVSDASGTLTWSGENVAKVWVHFNGTGTAAIQDSFNVTSLTDNGTGDYTITFDVDFNSNLYAPVVTHALLTDSDGVGFTSLAASSIRFSTATAGSVADPTVVALVIFGDQ